MYQFIATFHGVRGRYAVYFDGAGYSGQRLSDSRQLKYGYKPDSQGLWLHESFVYLGCRPKSIKPIAIQESLEALLFACAHCASLS